VDDAEDQHDPVLVDNVVHDPVVADPQTMERVLGSLDGLDGLAPDALGFRRIRRELAQGLSDALPDLGRQLLERPDGCRRQLDEVGAQERSSRLVV
jgi:hypothetical protein